MELYELLKLRHFLTESQIIQKITNSLNLNFQRSIKIHLAYHNLAHIPHLRPLHPHPQHHPRRRLRFRLSSTFWLLQVSFPTKCKKENCLVKAHAAK